MTTNDVRYLVSNDTGATLVEHMKHKKVRKGSSRTRRENHQSRELVGVGSATKVLYCADLDALADRRLVVEADGFGGARAMVIEGNYPIDFVAHLEKDFATEEDALHAAARIGERCATPSKMFG